MWRAECTVGSRAATVAAKEPLALLPPSGLYAASRSFTIVLTLFPREMEVGAIWFILYSSYADRVT